MKMMDFCQKSPTNPASSILMTKLRKEMEMVEQKHAEDV
jgi:hypothetical protein